MTYRLHALFIFPIALRESITRSEKFIIEQAKLFIFSSYPQALSLPPNPWAKQNEGGKRLKNTRQKKRPPHSTKPAAAAGVRIHKKKEEKKIQKQIKLKKIQIQLTRPFPVHTVPKYVFLMNDASGFPKTASGKIQKFKLREQAISMLQGTQ